MRALSVVLAVTAVACVTAFPSTFWSVAFSNAVGCTGTVSSTSYYPTDVCIVNTGGSTLSVKYTVANNAVVTTRYTVNRDCTGANSVNNVTYANNQCDNQGGTYAKYTFPVSGMDFFSTTSYTSSDCSGTPTDGPSFSALGGCFGGGGSYAMYSVSGGQLHGETFTTAGCTGSATQSFDIPKGCLARTGGSTLYDFNAAMGRAPQFVVAAVAIVAALVSFRL